MWVVDLNYNFECDWLISTTTFIVISWLIELSGSKLASNNLASELVENRSLLNQSQSGKL